MAEGMAKKPIQYGSSRWETATVNGATPLGEPKDQKDTSVRSGTFAEGAERYCIIPKDASPCAEKRSSTNVREEPGMLAGSN